MAHLKTLTLNTVARTGQHRDPVQDRRNKFLTAIEEQKQVWSAQLKGQQHAANKLRWVKNERGERALVNVTRPVKPWFFQQQDQWYLQLRYGARIVLLDGQNNAVCVKSLKEVGDALDTVAAAVKAGELDGPLGQATKRKARA